MKRTILNRSVGLATLALAASLSLSACGSEEPASSAGDTTESESPMESEEPTESEEPMAASATAPFGPGCAAVPTEGEGSVKGMADDPVATAASNNPLLKTLVSAVTQADLVDTLNSAEDITVFAPTDDAFAKIPKKDLNAVLKDKKALTAILTHHVVPGQLAPEDLAGTHETLNKDQITVEGSGEDFTAEGAAVICGNVPTANATVYVIDSVMMPAM
jgi:uncharacterized surface protein with fasciclin (FAS1) repeats